MRKLVDCMGLNSSKSEEDTPKAASKPNAGRKARFGASPARCRIHIRPDVKAHIWPDFNNQIQPDVRPKSGRM